MSRVVSLKRLADIRYGLGQPPPQARDGTPIIRATNIFRGRIDPTSLIHTRLEDLDLNRTPLLEAGEILVVRSGAYTGDSALVTESWSGAAPGYDLRVSPRGADPRFLAWSLLGNVAVHAMTLASSRAAQPHLNAEELGDVPISDVSPEEQRRIADFLDDQVSRIDRLIELRQRQAQLSSEHLNHWLDLRMQQLSQEFGSAPVRRFVRGVEQGGSPLADNISAEPGGVGVLKTSAIKNGMFAESENKALLDMNHLESTSIIHHGDVLVVRGSGSGDLVADTAYVGTEPRSTLMLSDLVYRLRQPSVNPQYLTWVLLSRGVRGQIRALVLCRLAWI